MPQNDTAHAPTAERRSTRKPRSQTYLSNPLTDNPSACLLPSLPDDTATVQNSKGLGSYETIRGGSRPGAGRRKRAAPGLSAISEGIENTIPEDIASLLSNPPPQKRRRTILGERDVNVDNGNRGGLRSGSGRKLLTIPLTEPHNPPRPINRAISVVIPFRDPQISRPPAYEQQRAHSVVIPPRDPQLSSPPTYEERLALPPAPEYSESHLRLLRRQARQERTTEDRNFEPPARRRAPYRRRNAQHGGRTLGTGYMLYKDVAAAKQMDLYRVDQDFYNPSNKCPHCSAQSWPEERGQDNRWQCCDNGKNDWISPDQSIKPEDVDMLDEGAQKESELKVLAINKLLYDIEDVWIDGQPTQRRTARSKEFYNNIVSYNNCLSFTSEGTSNVDYRVGRTTFRIQGSVHHLMGPLIPNDGLKPKFAQIYTLDGTQDQIDTRQHYFNELDRSTLQIAQRCLRSINPYIQGFKSCYDRLKEDEEHYPIEAMSVRIQQLDPKRTNRGTHNRPTSTEVARVMITPTDAARGRIDRDIRVETKEGGLMSIPDWHPSYMALRYPLLFPFGEQSWHDRIPIAGHHPQGDHPLHASRRNRMGGTLVRHGLNPFDDEPEQEDGVDPEHQEGAEDSNPHAARGRGGSTRLTRRAFYVKWMQIRDDYFNRVILGGRLFSHWVTDTWASIELNDLNWYRQNQQSIRADCYSGLIDRLSTDPDISLKDVGSKITILPSTMPGSPRYMKAKMQDAMAIVRKKGKPEYFITFTCNPKWPDLQSLLKPGQTQEYRHDLTARVFKLKLDELLKDLLEKYVLGVCVAHCYVIEFQKRGLPHAHILLIMRPEDRIHAINDVDSVIQAYIPKQEDDPTLRAYVLQHMVHNRCTGIPTDVCYSKEKQCCSKAYPKDLREETTFAPDGSNPFYRRFSIPLNSDDEPDINRWVVPYNACLLKKYGAHINIEMCGSIKSVFYLYKYVYKGPDRADITVTRQSHHGYEDHPAPSGQPRIRGEAIDEITEVHSARWIGSAEAVWKMLSFGMGSLKPHVERLQIHLPNQQRTLFQAYNNQAANQLAKQRLVDSEKLRRTTLTEFFAMNKAARIALDQNLPLPFTKSNGKPPEIIKNPLDYLYTDFPEHFTWIKAKKQWKVRERGETIGRIVFISPKSKDLYFCRLLLSHRKGSISFNDLRTVEGRLLEWKEACVELGLTENDRHADEVLEEGRHMQGGYGLRSLFVMVLLELQPTDALALWAKYKEFISEDCLYILRRDLPRLLISDADEASYAEQYALYLIDAQLEHASTPECIEDLARYHLPIPIVDFDGFSDVSNRLLREEISYDISLDDVELAWGRLNPDQRVAANQIVTAVAANEDDEYGAPGALFFLNGAGGTGKTFVQNTVMQRLRSEHKVALAVASSGIAATLLEGGRTAHSRFKIPLDSDATSSCGIKKGTNLAELVKRAAIIFWDESPMQSRFDMEAVSRSLQDICDNEQAWFGGKVVCFCGDFRQTLPVVPGGSSGQVIGACIQMAEFWPDVVRLDLTINERLNNPDLTDSARVNIRKFASDLLTIGNGDSVQKSAVNNEDIAYWEHGHVLENVLDELIEKVYTNIGNTYHTFDRNYLSERAILAITNRDVASINNKIMTQMPGELTTYWSVDRAACEEDEDLFPTEYFNAFFEASLPPHKLCVKPGVPVMLLRNLDPPRLCNGTRLRITRCGKQIFEGEIMGGTHDGEKVMLFKTPLQSKENNKHIPTPFVRKQYPVRPAFAMTINKSQGQSMKFVGINLQSRPVFSHGQLYVALSRVTTKANLHVIGPNAHEYTNERLMKNIVYKQVLLGHLEPNNP